MIYRLIQIRGRELGGNCTPTRAHSIGSYLLLSYIKIVQKVYCLLAQSLALGNRIMWTKEERQEGSWSCRLWLNYSLEMRWPLCTILVTQSHNPCNTFCNTITQSLQHNHTNLATQIANQSQWLSKIFVNWKYVNTS